MNKLKRAILLTMFTILIIFMAKNIVKATTVEVTTETLNLREEPTTDSAIVALISIGDECEVLGEEGDWYRVKYEDYTGYISKEYAKIVGEEENSNSTTDENTTDDETKQDEENSSEGTKEDSKEETTNAKTSDIANVVKKRSARLSPLINGSSIGSAKTNEEVTILSTINGWSFIQTDEISGWVRSDTIKLKENQTDKETDKVDDKEDDKNSENTDNNDNKDNQKDNEKDNESKFEEKTMYTTDLVNIRKEPSTDSDIVMVVDVNTKLKVIGENGNWYQVETSEGNAYVSKDYLSTKQTEITTRGSIDRTAENDKDVEKEDSKSSSKKTETEQINSSNTNNVTGSKIVSYAKKFLGVPYVYGGASPSGFDCSGFTMYVYDKYGVSMSHGAQAQSRLGKKVSANKSSKTSLLNNLKAGDLVFFLDYETMDEIGHCGIYIGNGNFIHASSGSGYCVKIDSLLPGEYYNTRYCAARRVI